MQSTSKRRFVVGSSVPAAGAALLALGVVLAMGPAGMGPDEAVAQPSGERAQRDAAPARFVEIPGEMEFTGRMLVRPKQADELMALGASEAQALAMRDQAVDMIRDLIVSHRPGPDRYVVDLPLGKDENEFGAELMGTGLFDFAHPDWLCFPAQTTPNDPLYNQQWQHVNMDSALAWDISQGLSAIVVAVVDSGVDLDHPDLQASLVPGYNSVVGIPQADGGEVDDLNGHGTACAGCVAAIGNNGVGMAGIGWRTSIMPVRCSNVSSGSASLGAILGGAEWAVENGARASSCSYTGVQSTAVGQSGSYIKSIGGLLIYAANNSNQNHSGFDWDDTVVVGATNQSDNKAGFSSYGLGVDLFAPGVDVGTTYNGGGYGPATGTSFATPIVAGLVGLIWGINPALTPEEVETFLYLGCDDLGEPGEDEFWGWGRANSFNSAQFAAGTLTPQPPTANPDFVGALAGTTLTIDVLANDFDINLDEFEILSAGPTSANGGTVTVLPPIFANNGQIRYVPPAGFSGIDTFTYTLIDENDMVSDPGVVTIDLIPLDAYKDPDQVFEPAPGIPVSYYSIGSQSSMPDFDQFEPIGEEVAVFINEPSTSGEFMNSGLSDFVGAVFEGFVQVPTLGSYTFFTESDDGSLLYIGDELVVNNDGLHGMVEQSGTILLKPGTHRIRVEFFENGGGAGLFVRWQGPGINKGAVPGPAWLYDLNPGGPTCAPDLNGDGSVDSDDLGQLLGAFGTSNPAGDVNGDGFVDSDDLGELLGQFGITCP
ncbi:MAG: S8 family serine peptidase [Phycisphaerales bacterium]